MGYTYDTAAQALGVSRATYADWVTGRSRTTDGQAGGAEPGRGARVRGASCGAGGVEFLPGTP